MTYRNTGGDMITWEAGPVALWPEVHCGQDADGAAHEQLMSDLLLSVPGTYGLVSVCHARMHAHRVRRRVRSGAGPWAGGWLTWDVEVRRYRDGDAPPQWRVYVAYLAELAA